MAEEKKVTTEKTKAKGKNGADASKFFKETVVELKKVVWPTRRQLVVFTAVVILASIAMSLFIWGFDTLFGSIDKLLVSK